MHAILLLSLLSTDAEPFTAPKGAAPTVVHLKAGGKVVRQMTKLVPFVFTVKVKVMLDGKVVEKEEARTAIKSVTEETVAEIGMASYSTADGKKLEGEALKKALAKDQIAVLSADGKPVDRSYLKAFKADTLVIVPMIDPADLPPPGPRD
ncbi:MAG: hypothetical protein K2W96_03660 [Gemmataceae bacterium]|nr:hypothetical protein [Gemmataceae bacterium]